MNPRGICGSALWIGVMVGVCFQNLCITIGCGLLYIGVALFWKDRW